LQPRRGNQEETKGKFQVKFISNSPLENKRNKKGRKRTQKFKSTSMFELIEEHVIPKWKEYMKSKTARREGDSRKEPRTDTMWKKILRDVREFFRILFRKRFHHLEYKDSAGALKCVELLFDELGIPLKGEYLNDSKLF
jgi:hypothetical protein